MSSKVYDKPDITVERVWECESLPGMPFAVFNNHHVCALYDDHPGGLAKPVASDGRWRPYQPNNTEPWPPRKLMPRRCWATVKDSGKRCLFINMPNENDGITFRCIDSNGYSGSQWLKAINLSDIHWIDPEQEAVEVGQ